MFWGATYLSSVRYSLTEDIVIKMFLALQDYRGFRCLEDFYPPLKARNIVKEEFGFTEDTLEIKAEKYLAVRKKIYKLIEKRSMPKK